MRRFPPLACLVALLVLPLAARADDVANLQGTWQITALVEDGP